MQKVKQLAAKALAFLKQPAVSHGLLLLAAKSKYSAVLLALLGAALGIQ